MRRTLLPLLFVPGLSLHAADIITPPTGFIPDQGQFADASGKRVPGLHYVYRGDGLNVQLRDGGFSYELWEQEKDAKQVRLHRIDVDLVGSDPNAAWEASGASSDVLNWYSATTGPEGVIGIHHYSDVLCRDIYPHIDLAFHVTDGGRGVKYDLIVRPGGDPSAIRMNYGGAEAEAKSASVLLTWADGALEDRMPESYWQGTREQASVAMQRLADGSITYLLRGERKAGGTLVIDPVPTRQWGTYYGGEDHHGNLSSVAIDASGNVIAAGTASITGLASSGAYDQTLANEDALLIKFNASGARLWATYYGGTNTEAGHGVAVDANGAIYLCGETWSTGSIATAGAHQTTLGSAPDGFLVKFNSTGTRAWGTYYGGTLEDRAKCVTVDGAGNPAIAGLTFSLAGIATAGAPDISYGGAQDAFFCKFTAAGARVWGTYLGGSGSDGATAVSNDGAWFFVAGTTRSTSSIAQGAVHQPSLNTVGTSMRDAFLVKYSNNGIKSWGTYYGGTGSDYGTGCVAELQTGNVYLTGQTEAPNGIATAGAFQTGLAGGQDGFLVKFDAACTQQWGTYIGGANEENVCGVTLGSLGRVFVAGDTDSPSGISTINAWQPAPGGSIDAFALCFTPAGARLWGTYYGDINYDAAHGLAVSDFDLVLGGITASPNGLSTPGAFQTTANIGPGKYGKFIAQFSTPVFFAKSLTSTGDPVQLSARFEGQDLLLTLPATDIEEEAVLLRITDALGRTVAEARTIVRNGQARIPWSEQATGVYVITVESEQERWGTRVLRP